LAATIIPTAIFAYSLLGYLFGMSLRPGWHSTLFAPEFVLVALYSGVAFMIVLMWVYRKQHHLEDLITDQHFYYAGYTLLLLIFGFAYFTFSEYITEWYNVSVTHGKWINKFLDFNEFGTMSMVTILFAIFIPAVILIIPKFRSIGSITFVSLLALIGLWFKRYLIIVPTLETPYFPIQDVRPEYVNYQATWVEWALTLGGVALGVILIMLMNYFSPAVPIAEMEHADEIEVPKPFYHSIK
jgi:molybdopterin-containing oxidoreductase family membrane subunit